MKVLKKDDGIVRYTTFCPRYLEPWQLHIKAIYETNKDDFENEKAYKIYMKDLFAKLSKKNVKHGTYRSKVVKSV